MASDKNGGTFLDENKAGRVSESALDAGLDHAYEHGLPRGERPGWQDLDELYTVAPSQWTAITGVPGHGKSELLDAIMVNLALRADWQFSVFSPENQPHYYHMQKIAEKYVGKPFNRGPNDRMTAEERDEAKAWFHQHFRLLHIEKPELDRVLTAAMEQTRSMPKRKTGIVIDPWNAIEHFRPAGMTVDEYLSWALSLVMGLTRKNDIHIFVVAHPKSLSRDRDGKRPIPTPYDISGGAHWFNKADNILTVWRDTSSPGNQEVEVHVQKIKFKHIGRLGIAKLRYDRITGRYNPSFEAVNRMAAQYRGDE
jgi:twinkle protein